MKKISKIETIKTGNRPNSFNDPKYEQHLNDKNTSCSDWIIVVKNKLYKPINVKEILKNYLDNKKDSCVDTGFWLSTKRWFKKCKTKLLRK